mgnify:CR=1 FL=1
MHVTRNERIGMYLYITFAILLGLVIGSKPGGY